MNWSLRVYFIVVIFCKLNITSTKRLNVSGAVLAYVTNDIRSQTNVQRKYNDFTQKWVTTHQLYIRSSCSTMYPKLRKPQSKEKLNDDHNTISRSTKDKFVYNNSIDEFLARVYKESLNLIKYIQSDIEYDVDKALRNGFKIFRTDEHNEYLKGCEENDCLYKIADTANGILKKVINAKADINIKHHLYRTVDTVKTYHYEYICKHYNVCRTKSVTFVEYCIKYLELLIHVKKHMLKQFFITLAETLHRVQIETIMNDYQRERIKYNFVVISTEAELFLSNRIGFLHSILSGTAKGSISPTEYRLYRGLIKTCEDSFEISEPWNKLLIAFTSWTKGERVDLKYIISTTLKYLNNEIKKWKPESIKDFNNNVNYLMGVAEEEDVTTSKPSHK